jgi:photosystem II stability/assembly factor-like uncharacterized protein
MARLAGPGSGVFAFMSSPRSPEMRRLAAALIACIAVGGLAEPVDAANWSSRGPGGGLVAAIAIDPVVPSTLYAGSFWAGVFKSIDSGRTWTRQSAGLPPDIGVFDIVVSPSDRDTVYARVFLGPALYRSTNSGATWTKIASPSSDDVSINDFAVDPNDPETLYAATWDGLYRTTDAGAHWTRMRAGIPFHVAIAPTDPDVLYLESNGIYRSDDRGQTWTETLSWFEQFDVFEVDPADARTLYVSTHEALYRLSNGSTVLSRLLENEPLHTIEAFGIGGSPRVLYAATLRGEVFKSTDEGGSWQSMSTGLPANDLRDLEVDPLYPSRVYASFEDRGVYRTTNGGSEWVPANRQLAATVVNALAAHPTRSAILYAGTRGGVAKTTDGGRNWYARGLDGRRVLSLAIHPSKPQTLFAAAWSGGLFRTTDGGQTWRRRLFLGYESMLAVALAPSAPRIVYVGTFEEGLYRSPDSGLTWRRVARPDYGFVRSLAVHPRRANTVWMGTWNGVQKSIDGGRTWVDGQGAPMGEVYALVVEPARPNIVYAAAEIGGVHVSRDGGLTWRPADTVPLQSGLALVVDPLRPGTIYAGGWTEFGVVGVAQSRNRGSTWTDLTGNLTTRKVESLALNPAGTVLHAGTSGGGVFSARVE